LWSALRIKYTSSTSTRLSKVEAEMPDQSTLLILSEFLLEAEVSQKRSCVSGKRGQVT
jgi:hypothetical protein